MENLRNNNQPQNQPQLSEEQPLNNSVELADNMQPQVQQGFVPQVPQGFIPPEPKPQKPPRNFTGIEVIMSWICLVLGYLFCRAFPLTSNPFGGFVFTVILFTASVVMLKLHKAQFKIWPFVVGLSALLVSAGSVLSSNGAIQFFSFTYALASIVYFVFATYGNCTEKGLSDFLPIDYLRAMFVVPFSALGAIFKALFYGRAKKGGRSFVKILLGIVAAIIPTIIVTVLLSYDESFSELMAEIFDFGLWDIFSHMFSIGNGLLLGSYIYGLFIASHDRSGHDGKMTVESCRHVSDSMKFVPWLTTVAATLPLALIYVVFFISQWKYYISGFKGELPDDLVYSQYARDGFFQLLTVSVINLLIIIAMSLFVKKGKNGKSPVVKIVAVVYSLFTLVLISTAIAKMVMYIDCYGLTRKRVYASWFMILLSLVFLAIIIKQFIGKFKSIAVSSVICVVLFGAVALINVDGFIARYNVDRYLDGSISQIDINELYRMGDSGVPEMVRLAEELDKRNDTDIRKVVNLQKIPNIQGDDEQRMYYALARALKTKIRTFDDEHDDIFSYTLPAVNAEKALDSISRYRG